MLLFITAKQVLINFFLDEAKYILQYKHHFDCTDSLKAIIKYLPNNTTFLSVASSHEFFLKFL